MNELEEEKKLPKHINTAVNAIQKQIDKYLAEVTKHQHKIEALNKIIGERWKDVDGLAAQIAKLKGE